MQKHSSNRYRGLIIPTTTRVRHFLSINALSISSTDFSRQTAHGFGHNVETR